MVTQFDSLQRMKLGIMEYPVMMAGRLVFLAHPVPGLCVPVGKVSLWDSN